MITEYEIEGSPYIDYRNYVSKIKDDISRLREIDKRQPTYIKKGANKNGFEKRSDCGISKDN